MAVLAVLAVLVSLLLSSVADRSVLVFSLDVSQSVSEQGDAKAMALPSRQRPWQKRLTLAQCPHILNPLAVLDP